MTQFLVVLTGLVGALLASVAFESYGIGLTAGSVVAISTFFWLRR